MPDKNFTIEVNDAISFELSEEDVKQLDVIPLGEGKYHLINHHRSEEIEILKADFLNKKYEVLVNGNKYEVKINNSLDKLIKDLGFEIGSAKTITNLNSPMPGLILQIDVKAGDEVKKGDSLLILEAMKMENVLSSPRDGVIKTVDVSVGDAIEKNQLLLTFE